MERFAAWFRKELFRRHMNYSDVATILGVQPNTPRAWALGSNEPTLRHVQSLARAFDADLEMLFRLLGWLPQSNHADRSDTLHRIASKLEGRSPEVQLAAEEMLDVFLVHCAGK